MAALLEIDGVHKHYPGVIANKNVSLSVKRGEVRALLGENGAGKSTLVRMIYGVAQPTHGTIRFDGRSIVGITPRASRAVGISMIFQHFSLFQGLTVRENIRLGAPPLPNAELDAQTRRIMDAYDLHLDLDRQVGTLSIGEQQRIEILRVLLAKPKLLIMDEPTSVLNPREIAGLFSVVRRLASDGCAVLFISHKLKEVCELCESATILRGGEVVATCDPREETYASMAQMMIGERTVPPRRQEGMSVEGGVRLEVSDLNRPRRDPYDTALKGITFSARSGQIIGIAGVAGNGQAELYALLSGEERSGRADAIRIDGRDVGRIGIGGRRSLGLGAVPESRNDHGAALSFSLVENALLTTRERRPHVRAGIVRSSHLARYADAVINDSDVRTSGASALAGSLSGGNLQKFIMGREVALSPSVLIVEQPTWGVDPKAASAIRQALYDLASQGSAIVVISQDLDELLELCDRLMVIHDGRLSETFSTSELDAEKIGLMMGGLSAGMRGAEGGNPDAH